MHSLARWLPHLRMLPIKSTVQLDYVVRGNHAMFFVGKEKGYFSQNGIDLTAIQKGTGSPNAMRLVVTAMLNSVSAICRHWRWHAPRMFRSSRSPR